MWLLIRTLLPLSILISGCSPASTDLLESAVKQAKFADNDPQHFEGRTPHRHDVHGIDVSKWNGAIDWIAVKRSGVAFAFIKATEGKDRLDPKFHTHWQGATDADLPHAAYHFYYFCSSAAEQADWFIRNVPKEANLLPPVLDVEWNHTSPTCRHRPPPETVKHEMKVFMDRIEAHYGRRPIIYTSVDFHRDNLVGAFPDHHFWVRAVAQHPEVVYPDRNWTFWQYTSTGIVPGIDGETDINVFAGSRQNWHSWVASVSR
ncbi:glycoside hydrolase family 25 protein [Peteryoungia desertarenae]|uniref:Glycoside hydrolase family 25 protein n=1 Tax=Peteryoungia desertarenae TaxID=1813451 RepID=A0ABX6QQK0_9HYPH|nr:GH25 family lysozyme [Peteryoungia desertarenae]QLF70866.1 glycoside hydrolase family 25 protein [Peteryoungia desertarenae]